MLVIDDFTPSTTWSPRYAARIDTYRQHWLDHPDPARHTSQRHTEVDHHPVTGSGAGRHYVFARSSSAFSVIRSYTVVFLVPRPGKLNWPISDNHGAACCRVR
jgi:hypothetical protein